MNTSIINELESHLREYVDEGILTLDNQDDWFFHAFNEDPYIIGYYQAEQWLKKHKVGEFEAIAYVIEEQERQFAEVTLQAGEVNAEHIVNLIAYFAGFEALSNIEDELIELLGG